MISIIVASNDKELLDRMLIASLDKQTFRDFETIIVDAKKNGFSSASTTLNYGASLAKGDILLFVHQDIELLDNDLLLSIHEFCKKNDFGIGGVCGVDNSETYRVYSSVSMGYNHIQAGILNKDIRDIYVLDECLFFIKKEDFMGFDDLGKTWHFYAVDYSMKCHYKKKKVVLIPNPIYHLSPGWSLNYSYFDTLIAIGKKYPNEKYIKTCMGVFRNNSLLPIYCLYRKLKLFIKKKLGG